MQAIRCEYAGAINADVAALAAAVQTATAPPAVICTTLLMHASGQWISEELTMWPKENTPQAIGTCGAYARRYGISAMVGVYQEDDDGNKATHGRSEPEGMEDLQPYVDGLLDAIKHDDDAATRRIWNELNALGSTKEVWGALNTKEKGYVRDLLQRSTPAVAAEVVVTRGSDLPEVDPNG